MRGGTGHFVDFDLIDRIVGVSPCHPQAMAGVAVLTRTYEDSIVKNGHDIGFLLEVSIRPLISNRSKHKALRFKSRGASGFSNVSSNSQEHW